MTMKETELYNIEQRQKKEDERIAKFLGITYDELHQTKWHLEEELDEDGLFKNYIVLFEEEPPKNIKNKIKDLIDNTQVVIPPYEIEEEEDYYFEEQFEVIIDTKDFYENFRKEVENVKLLNELEIDSKPLLSILKKQLFITLIGALETFLSETFINLATVDDVYFRNFIETYPNFKERKFQLNEIFQEYEKINMTAKREMLEVIYHNLPKVKNMYTSTFKIVFPDIVELLQDINTRHDLVHRNGKTKDGKEIIIQKDNVSDLIIRILDFGENIRNSLEEDFNKYQQLTAAKNHWGR